MSRDGFGVLPATALDKRTLVRCRVRAVASFAVLLAASLLPARAAAERMKLLTRDTGWVADTHSLYWTSDGGADWADITPVVPGVGPEGLTLHSVFFLDTSQGWVVISHDERVAAPTFQEFMRPKTVYGIARTGDGGQTWSLAPLTYPELPEWEQQALGPPDDLFFLDPTHGWMVMLMVGSSNFAPGKLLATRDGGVSWNWVNSPGTIGTLLFTSTQNGWLAGGPGGQRLYVTHDACKSWEEVALTPPPQVSAPSNPVVEGAPVFGDGGQGFVAVAYEGREGAGSKLVAYATEDGGKTWKPRKILPESKLGAEFSVSIVGSSIVVPTALDKAGVSVAVVPLTGGLTSGVVVSRTGVSDLSFADASDGLALTTDGRVQYTWDGGATWRDITPSHLRTTPEAFLNDRPAPTLK